MTIMLPLNKLINKRNTKQNGAFDWVQLDSNKINKF